MTLHRLAPTEGQDGEAELARVRWQFMHSRRNALKLIDQYIHRLDGLRSDHGADGIEPLMDTYRNARRALESIGAGASPAGGEMVEFATRLKELREDLIAVAKTMGIGRFPA